LTFPESKECPSSDVTVCIGPPRLASLFVHVTLSPTRIETAVGLKAKFLIETDMVAASADAVIITSEIEVATPSMRFRQLRDRLAVITRRYGPPSQMDCRQAQVAFVAGSPTR
jgi:hypothetical protein